MAQDSSLRIRPLSKVSVADPIKEEPYMKKKPSLRQLRTIDKSDVFSNRSMGNHTQGDSLGVISAIGANDQRNNQDIEIDNKDVNVNLA